MTGDAHGLRAALLTPPGRGAIATIGVSGPGAGALVARCVQRRGGRSLASVPHGRIVLGRWSPPGGDAAEIAAAACEEVVVCQLADDALELHCHGGRAASEAILASLARLGCQICDWEHWASTSLDPIAAEALTALSRARTERTAALLLDQYHGALAGELRAIVELLQRADDAAAAERLSRLERSAALGLHLADPFRVVLAGRPNVGKSSLINALVGYQRAIVLDQPGTTRDVVTASTALDGWPVELADTAGLRDEADELETAGMQLARERLGEADLVVLVHEAGQGCEQDERLIAQWPGALRVCNKCDLAPSQPNGRADVLTSATTGEGVEELAAAIARRLAPEAPEPGRPLVFTQVQLDAVQAAIAALAGGKRAEAVHSLRLCAGI